MTPKELADHAVALHLARGLVDSLQTLQGMRSLTDVEADGIDLLSRTVQRVADRLSGVLHDVGAE